MVKQFQYQQKAHLEVSPDIAPAVLAWLPSYPDFVREKHPNVRIGYICGDIFEETIPEPAAEFEGTWGGYQPSLLWKELWTSYPQSSEPIREPPISDPAFWAFNPIYPSFARGPQPRQPGLFSIDLSPALFGDPDTKWLPTYPDFVRGSSIQRQLITDQFIEGLFDVPIEDFPGSLGFLPILPHFARNRPELLQVGRTMFAVRVEFPHLSWQPNYPNFARTENLTIEHFRKLFSQVSPSDTEIVSPLSWESRYPDKIIRPRRLPHYEWPKYMVWAKEVVQPEPPEEQKGWRPITPVFARGVSRSPHLIQYFAWYEEIIPNPTTGRRRLKIKRWYRQSSG